MSSPAPAACKRAAGCRLFRGTLLLACYVYMCTLSCSKNKKHVQILANLSAAAFDWSIVDFERCDERLRDGAVQAS